jgi:hypothetical protein
MTCTHTDKFVTTCDGCLVELSADRAQLRSENFKLRDALVKRHAMEPRHSDQDHECDECVLLADMRVAERHICGKCKGNYHTGPCDARCDAHKLEFCEECKYPF